MCRWSSLLSLCKILPVIKAQNRTGAGPHNPALAFAESARTAAVTSLSPLSLSAGAPSLNYACL